MHNVPLHLWTSSPQQQAPVKSISILQEEQILDTVFSGIDTHSL